MHACLRYYTGTGNTARTVGILAEGLTAAGWSVDSAEVRWDQPPSASDLAGADLVVLAWPTLGFSAPSHFLRWVDRLPAAPGTRFALVACCAGFPGVSLRQVASRLGRRGCPVVSSTAAVTPDNWTQVLPPPRDEDLSGIFAIGDPDLRALAAAWAGGGGRRDRFSPVATAITAVVAVLFRSVGRRLLGKVYVSDPTCTGCGLCARACPAAAIRMRSGRPGWNLDCDVCNRCINLCPTRSIQVSAVRLAVHGGGNLALVSAALALVGSWGWPGALALLVGGTVLQLTLVDAGLGALEAIPAARRFLSLGWTSRWGRYRAPGFRV
jgi:NAD-dependent dihydropyrimidine dehydrogenase PreA subunit